MGCGDNYAVLGAAWIKMAEMEAMWVDGNNTGTFLIKLVLDHWGREPCEAIALYWNQKGRDDIAARVKAIIHEETKRP